MPNRNYAKEYGFKHQKKWNKENKVVYFTIHTYPEQKEALKSIANERGVSVSSLVKDAIKAQYGIDLSKSTQN